jgi:predicted DNA-binding transcriptional regulator AlpA
MSSRHFLTFHDLVERNIITSRTQLSRSIRDYGFPHPFKLGKARIVWDEAEVEAWLTSRRPDVPPPC